MVYDENEMRVDEQEDERLARILKEIANTVQEGIVMVEDTPSQNSSGKLPILDMEVWMTEEKKVVYRHYEKPMSNRRVMNAKSAQSSSCKKSVHVQELLRRILNTSSRLDWTTTVAPVLTDYMQRMKTAGYNEGCRKSVLGHALRIFDRMKQEDQDGIRPLYRPPDWQAEERRIDKRSKKHSWSTKGGFTAPIFVPATPNSELAKMFQQLADEESIPGLKFKIVESGGMSTKGLMQKSNPTATPGCSSRKCLACRGESGRGGPCRRGNIQYEVSCSLCPDEAKSAYVGETSRNLFARGMEHDRKLETQDKESFMIKHQAEKHDGQPASFEGRVTGSFRDCLSRQVSEGVTIRRCPYKILNSKSEWHQPSLWRVRSQLEKE